MACQGTGQHRWALRSCVWPSCAWSNAFFHQPPSRNGETMMIDREGIVKKRITLKQYEGCSGSGSRSVMFGERVTEQLGLVVTYLFTPVRTLGPWSRFSTAIRDCSPLPIPSETAIEKYAGTKGKRTGRTAAEDIEDPPVLLPFGCWEGDWLRGGLGTPGPRDSSEWKPLRRLIQTAVLIRELFE